MTRGEFGANGKAKYYHSGQINYRLREVEKYILYGDPSLYLFGIDINYNTPYFDRNRKKHMQQMKNNEILDDFSSVYIYSITGQLLRSCNNNELDIQGLPSGIYTIVLNSKNEQITKKIIIQ